MAFTTSVNNYNTTKWLVNPIAGLGTHTTIATALTSASSGDNIFIMPGTYTENPTLKAGVNLVAYPSDGLDSQVIINGKCSATFTGTCDITGIQLKTNSDFALSITGANATVVNLFNCYINCLNTTGIDNSGTGASIIQMFQCLGNIGTTGIALFAHSNTNAGSQFVMQGCEISNLGASTTANTFSGGVLDFFSNFIANPTTTSGTTALFYSTNNVYFLSNGGSAINSNSTLATNSVISVNDFFYVTGSTPLTVGASSILICVNGTTRSNSATAVSGSGTFRYANFNQMQTVGTLSATTLVSLGTIGNQAGTAVSAGYIGEVLTASATGVSLTSGSANNNITSKSLTPGVWLVTGSASCTATTSTTSLSVGVNATINTFTTICVDYNQLGGIAGLTTPIALQAPTQVFTITANTTYYLNVFVTFTGTGTGTGKIIAIRIA